jgi:N-acyl-L-homoserine lactone synthetase
VKILPFFAELDWGDYWPPQSMSPSLRESVFVIGSISIVAVLTLFWALFFRRHKHRRHVHGYHRHHHTIQEAKATLTELSRHLQHRQRRRRRVHRPRNPTLAETSGLPPNHAENP